MSVVTLLAIVTLAAICLYTLRRPLLRQVARALLSPQPPHADADAIVLLNGNISTRPFRAHELYSAHPAPVFIARLSDTEEVKLEVIPNISDATRKLLIKLGIPQQDIHVVSSKYWVAGTWGEANLLSSHLQKISGKRVNIVTDAFHTRRAQWTFNKVMANSGFDFRCAASRFTEKLEKSWWHSEYGLIQVTIEILKFAHYWMRFRNIPAGSGYSGDLPEDEVRNAISGRARKI